MYFFRIRRFIWDSAELGVGEMGGHHWTRANFRGVMGLIHVETRDRRVQFDVVTALRLA